MTSQPIIKGSARVSKILLANNKSRLSAVRLSRIAAPADPVQLCFQAARLTEKIIKRLEPIFADQVLQSVLVLDLDWRILHRELVTFAFSALKNHFLQCRGTIDAILADPMNTDEEELDLEKEQDLQEEEAASPEEQDRKRVDQLEKETLAWVEELQKLSRKIRPTSELLVELSQAQQTNLGELRVVLSCMKKKDMGIIDSALRDIVHVEKDESFQALESIRFLAKHCSKEFRQKYEIEHMNYVLRSDRPWLIYSLYRGLLI